MSISTTSAQTATLTRYRFVAVGSETSVSGVDANGNVLGYTVGMEQVYLNGVMLVRGSDYTATSGTSITALTALVASDVIEILTFSPFTITNAVDQTLVDIKGDLLVATGDNVVTRVAVGDNNTVLVADSTQTAGVKWASSLPSQTGNSGKFLTTNGTAESWGTVNQPTTWTLRGVLGDVIRTIAYNGSNLYVAAGDAGYLYTSSNGTTWTSRTSNFGAQSIYKVAYGNGLWVAVGGGGVLTTSTDGITWTARTSNMTAAHNIWDVVYANSIWVAVGAGGGTTDTGGIVYSTDGITWTRKSQSLSVGTTYHSVVWNGTNWVIGATSSTNNSLYASSPSGTWTASNGTSGGAIYKVIWDGTRHIYFANDWYFNTSTSHLAASSTAYASLGTLGATPLVAIAYYNNTVYFGEIYYTSFTPASTTGISSAPLQFAPTSVVSGGTTVSSGIGTIFAGAVGLIAAGGTKIYTSF
jgi:hypothetical protein